VLDSLPQARRGSEKLKVSKRDRPSRLPSEKHFGSLAGSVPDHRISGGKILSRRTRPVVNPARSFFRLAGFWRLGFALGQRDQLRSLL
jgi:hypothetical protein